MLSHGGFAEGRAGPGHRALSTEVVHENKDWWQEHGLAPREPCPRLPEHLNLCFHAVSQENCTLAGLVLSLLLLTARQGEKRRYRSTPCRKHEWRVSFIEVQVAAMIKKYPEQFP